MNAATELRLGDIACAQVLTIAPEAPLKEAIARLAAHRVSSLVVAEGLRPLGILTEQDVLRLGSQGLPDEALTVSSVMSHALVTAGRDLDFSAAQLLMSNRGIRHLVIVDDDGNLCGVVSETDFRRHFGHELYEAIQNLHSVTVSGTTLLTAGQPLIDALQLMDSQGSDHVVIGDDGQAEGILTERDVPRLLADRVNPTLVSLRDVMSRPLQTIPVSASVAEAAQRMERARVRHLVVVDNDGRMLGVVSQHRMLERLGAILMEESRLALESQLSMILEAIDVGVWEFDHRRQVLRRSQGLINVLRMPPTLNEEPLAQALKRVHPDDRAMVAAAFQEQLMGTEAGFVIDYRVAVGDGEIRWMAVRGRVIERDANGAPLRSAGAVVDIEPRKHSENQLRESEARFRGLIENLPLPLAYANGEGEFVFLNRHFKTLFGYGPSDVPSLDAWWALAYPDPDYRRWVIENWNEALNAARQQGGVIRPVEYRVRCANGKERDVEISGLTLGEDYLATLNDVTERRREQTLLQFSNLILQRISTGASLDEVLNFIVMQIEAVLPQTLCSVLLLDESGQRLCRGAGPSLPEAWNTMLDGLPIGPKVGACGAAASLGEPVFAGDIGSDPNWTRVREMALGFGLAACWSSPIMASSDKVLGTFAVYWSQPRAEPDEAAQVYVRAATALVAIAIENHRQASELRIIQEGLLRAEAIGGLGSWSLDLASGKMRWSDQLFRLLGEVPGDVRLTEADTLRCIHPDDQALVAQMFASMRKGKVPEAVVHRRHPDRGPLCYLLPSFLPRYTPDGTLFAFEGTLHDVTLTQLNEDRLRARLEELRRWQQVTLGREGRVLELKREVNALLARLGEAPRYSSVADGEVSS